MFECLQLSGRSAIYCIDISQSVGRAMRRRNEIECFIPKGYKNFLVAAEMTRLYHTHKYNKQKRRRVYRIIESPKRQWDLATELNRKIPFAENKYTVLQKYYENEKIDAELVIIDEQTTKILFLGKTMLDTVSVPIIKKQDGTYAGVRNVLLIT